MTWYLAAVLGHASNGVAFIIDKILLQKAFTRSATYAGLVGMLSLFSIIVLPWVTAWPAGMMFTIAVLSGVAFIFALRAFFGALRRAEASRIVPIVGSLVPVFTLIGTMLFLDERLTGRQGSGFAILVIATALLSGTGRTARPARSAVIFAVASSALFAASFVTGKAVYDAVGFLNGFLATRLAAGATALIMVTCLDPAAGKEILAILRPKRAGQPKLAGAAWLAIAGQSMGAGGFVLVQYAIAHGSASIVNAMQAVQYVLIITVAILSRRLRRFLNERLDKKTLAIKLGAIALAAIGMSLVV